MAGPRSLRQLRCFVASAFGKSDVDRVFSKLVKPTLKKMRVVVSRVDRINHNDDIDDKILELLNKADFCIADLTYARPSVYYEAGYAIASKPVRGSLFCLPPLLKRKTDAVLVRSTRRPNRISERPRKGIRCIRLCWSRSFVCPVG